MPFEITKGPVYKAQKIVVYGPEGIGKTSFAADFPDPVFIDTESGSNMYDVARLPNPTSWSMLRQEIQEVAKTKPCKTLIIDTIDWAERLCIDHICSLYQKQGIEDFGYGKGYILIYEEMGKLLNLLTDVVEAGIHVVLTAHAMLYKFEEPNEQGSYDRYTLKLTQKTSARVSAMVKEWADMVLFANYKTIVVTDSKTQKAKAQGGQRVMYTTHHPNWDAKNRFDLPDELPFEFKAIEAYLPIKQEMNQQPKPQKQKVKETAQNVPNNIPLALVQLMEQNKVTEDEIKRVVSEKGYFPIDMPVKDYPKEFVDGCLVAAWNQVLSLIKENREIPF